MGIGPDGFEEAERRSVSRADVEDDQIDWNANQQEDDSVGNET